MIQPLFLLLICLFPVSLSGAEHQSVSQDNPNRIDYESRLAEYNNLSEARQDDLDLKFNIALTQYKMGRYRDSQETINKLLVTDPDHIDAHYLAGILSMSLVQEVNLFKKPGLARAALDSWQNVVKLEPDHVQGNYALFSFYVEAPSIVGGNFKKGRRILKHLEAISPPYAELAKGLLNSKEKQYEAAETHYLNATKTITDRASPFFAISIFYFEREEFKKALDALQQYQKADKIWHDPGPARTYYAIGSVYAAMDQVQLARTNFEKALLVYPNKRIKGLVGDALRSLK